MDIYSRDRKPIVPNYLQVLRVLNHAGICLSYEATWQYLKQLTREANFTDMVKCGHWIWVYDNLNFRQAVRHERSGKLLSCSTEKRKQKNKIMHVHFRTQISTHHFRVSLPGWLCTHHQVRSTKVRFEMRLSKQPPPRPAYGSFR